MCHKCGELDHMADHYRRLAKGILDKRALEAIDRMLAQLDAEKLALHPAISE